MRGRALNANSTDDLLSFLASRRVHDTAQLGKRLVIIHIGCVRVCGARLRVSLSYVFNTATHRMLRRVTNDLSCTDKKTSCIVVTFMIGLTLRFSEGLRTVEHTQSVGSLAVLVLVV